MLSSLNDSVLFTELGRTLVPIHDSSTLLSLFSFLRAALESLSKDHLLTDWFILFSTFLGSILIVRMKTARLKLILKEPHHHLLLLLILFLPRVDSLELVIVASSLFFFITYLYVEELFEDLEIEMRSVRTIYEPLLEHVVL